MDKYEWGRIEKLYDSKWKIKESKEIYGFGGNGRGVTE